MAIKLHTKESIDLFNTIERVRLAAGNNQFTIALCGDLARLCAMIHTLQGELEMTQKREHAAIRWGNRMKTDLDAEIIRLEGQRDTMTSAMLAAEERLEEVRQAYEKCCLWDYDNARQCHDSECGKWMAAPESESPFKYCPFCGGIITAM